MTQHGFGEQLVAEGDMGITREPLTIAGLHQRLHAKAHIGRTEPFGLEVGVGGGHNRQR